MKLRRNVRHALFVPCKSGDDQAISGIEGSTQRSAKHPTSMPLLIRETEMTDTR